MGGIGTLVVAIHQDPFVSMMGASYDVAFRRQAAAIRDLHWGRVDSTLYNEAFAGRARMIPRCRYCLGESHSSEECSYAPAQPIMFSLSLSLFSLSLSLSLSLFLSLSLTLSLSLSLSLFLSLSLSHSLSLLSHSQSATVNARLLPTYSILLHTFYPPPVCPVS